jgi:hypothetical protein
MSPREASIPLSFSPVMNDHTVDDFSDAESWLPVASGEAELRLTSEPSDHGRALRMDFDFKGGGGFVVARKAFGLLLPETYAFTFRVRGEAPKNKLEFKLADTTDKNVWRWQEENFEFALKARSIHLKNRQIDFAWGPAGGGTLRKLGAVEFVISAGPGGKGTVWLEDFRFEDRTSRKTPAVSASDSAKGTDPQAVLQNKSKTGWRSAPRDARPWLHLDFHEPREYGGLIIEWAPLPAKRAFDVQASDDGKKWRTIHRMRSAEGARSFVYLPGDDSRHLRLAFQGPAAIRRIEVQPYDFSRSHVEFFHGIAERSPKGHYPRWLIREQSYWTCSGAPEGLTSALINEDALVEPDMGTFTLEPFLHVNGKLVTWADAQRSVRQEEDGLAIPSAAWKLEGLTLEATTFATGRGAEAVLFVRYRIGNTSRKSQRVKLFVALRPFEVNPPWQSAQGMQGWPGLGGVSEIREIAWKDGVVQINRDKWVVPLTKAAAFGAAAFEQGAITDYLAAGKLPAQKQVRDAFAFASGAMRFDLAIAAEATRDVYIAVPFGMKRRLGAKQLRELATTDGAAQFEEAVRVMRDRLASVSFRLPAGVAREAAHTFRTAAGQILINRDGAALQPGPRRYTRSWVRDGVIMGAALLRIGDKRALPEFMSWYAPYQREDGFVPCCVDRTGPDWLVEHDSHGQLIYGVMESFRFTADRDFLEKMWPYVCKAARFIEKLRAERLTVEYQTPEKLARYGLLPESASHEGYLAHPVHAYWDDFWALRGLRDAAVMATELGHADDARDFAALAFSFRETLYSSIRKVIADKNLHYVPGSVEWADFDPTATANAVTLLQGMAHLPAEQLDEMFAHFMRDFRRKHSGAMPWTNYTAYEIRIVGALVHLGRRADALELLQFFLADRRPRHWNQWPEISWKNPRSPGHLGDVPHTWIASEYMLVFVCLFAYEREADDALIIGAGVDDRWIASREGITVSGLPTWHGTLELTMKRGDNGTLIVTIGGALRQPRGGFVVRPPGGRSIQSLTVNDVTVSTFTEREATIHELPARAVLTFGDPIAQETLLKHPPFEA